MTERTKQLYQSRLKKFFDFKNEKVYLDKIEGKSRNYICQIRAAVKYYFKSKGKFYHDDKLNNLFYNANKPKKNKKDTLQLKSLIYKLNALKNKKLKTLYKLQLISGLRVEEISKLDLNKDVEYVENNRLILNVQGKGEKPRKIKTLPDEYVYENLKTIDKPYNYKTLINKACEHGFATHDFRRTFAQIIYYNTGDKNLVKKLLGHEKIETTEIYLKRDINFYGTKWDF
jgi:integrase